MDTKGASKMKVIYDEELSQIVLAAEDGIATILHTDICSIDTPIFNVDKRVPLDIATRIFQRWHQIDQSAEPEFIAQALEDALNGELSVYVGETKVDIYSFGLFDNVKLPTLMCQLFNQEKILGGSLHVKHNITEDQVDYFIDGRLKGWLPIVRKEITS